MHNNTQVTTGNIPTWPLTASKRIYLMGLAREQRSNTTGCRTYWMFKRLYGSFDRLFLKGRHIVTPEVLQKQALQQLHINLIRNCKTKLVVHKSIYGIGMNVDFENHIKNCCTCLDFQKTQLKEILITHEIPGQPWEVNGADMFTLYNRNYLCNVDYHNKFPVIKKSEDLFETA